MYSLPVAAAGEALEQKLPHFYPVGSVGRADGCVGRREIFGQLQGESMHMSLQLCRRCTPLTLSSALEQRQLSRAGPGYIFTRWAYWAARTGAWAAAARSTGSLWRTS